jgi:hypothetical protein
MQILPIKKKWVIVWSIVAVFVILNPGVYRFKENRGYDSTDGLKRTANFFVFSIYEDAAGDPPYDYYLGILWNFIPL